MRPVGVVGDVVPQAERSGIWRIGFTRFATRMLGELVELSVDVQRGSPIRPGDRLGTVEGFKAVSDLYAVIEGCFEGINPEINAEACLTHSDPHGAGWLYAAEGIPEPGVLDVHGYIELLAGQIDRLQASRYSGGAPDHPPSSAENHS
ncbi:MAG: glycine cleavage system protein H [Planctomycetaceae bacterium]